MKYGEALKEGTGYLENCGVPDAAADAWYLMEYCTSINRAEYLLKWTEEMDPGAVERYQELLQKRGSRIPLQYITGEQEFMGLPFLVNGQVLIPRQDTEILVETALKVLRPGMRVLDLCTGSGCIIISLGKEMPGMDAWGSDLSEGALDVARRNGERLQVPVSFVQSDLFEKIEGKFDLIVSNPPYIPTETVKNLMPEVRLHEPWSALDGKEDGLWFYGKITEESGRYLADGGWLMLEIGCDQGQAVTALMRRAGYAEIKIWKDLAGLDRVVTGRRN